MRWSQGQSLKEERNGAEQVLSLPSNIHISYHFKLNLVTYSLHIRRLLIPIYLFLHVLIDSHINKTNFNKHENINSVKSVNHKYKNWFWVWIKMICFVFVIMHLVESLYHRKFNFISWKIFMNKKDSYKFSFIK